jgi:2-polyprenyl-3-methyl-5-hydroxy-6-metoxy-1,4-benzoquinol methylase
MAIDKAGKSYWDHTWENRSLPQAIDPCAKGLTYYVDRKFHEFFRETFSELDTKERTILEIGCAGSRWLPYFAKEFGFRVCGLDYSELGCHQARQVLAEAGVKGEVVCCDFFSPPQSLLKAFDVVVSFGVVEHFENTAGCLTAFSEFLKPGGLMVTNIPNMVGMIGSLQKVLNRAVFDIHVPMDERRLAAGHEPSLQVLSCRYFLIVNWSVVNIENCQNKYLHRIALSVRSSLSKGFWILEDFIPFIRPNRVTSPYINCVARKPCA